MQEIKSENIVSEKVITKTFKDAFKNDRIIRIRSGPSVAFDNPENWVENVIPLNKMKHFCLHDNRQKKK